MRTELKRIGAVEELNDGRIKPLKRSVVGGDNFEKLVSGFSQGRYTTQACNNNSPSAVTQTG